MSVEEDLEFKDLLAETLESNGSLAKIRAQLRACVFLALDENELMQKKQPLQNKKIKDKMKTSEGKLMFCLVREFLEYFDLNYTLSVYDSESYAGTEYVYEGKAKLCEELNLDVNKTVPLISQLIKKAQENNIVNGNDEEKSETPCDDQGTSSLSKSNEVSVPILKDLKAKNKSHLTDLPPFALNKSRNSDMLLPSLYSRDFKEQDGFIETKDNYEEDFISDTELEHKGTKISYRDRNDSIASSITSQDFDLDSNVDDILKSN